jgi:hypothetical protein
VRFALSGWVALTLTSGCLRFGYDSVRRPGDRKPDAALADAGAMREHDAAVADARPARDAAVGGSGGRPAANGGGGRGGQGVSEAGAGGSAARARGSDPGIDVDQTIGDTGLHVADILGFYSGDWGDMVLRAHGDVIWGVYAHAGGTLVGTIESDGVFRGWWTQLPLRIGTDAGEVEFRWSQTNGQVIALDGRWRYGTIGSWLENWDIDLVTDRQAPTDLTDRFDTPGDFVGHP